jgi:hypothetical protein
VGGVGSYPLLTQAPTHVEVKLGGQDHIQIKQNVQNLLSIYIKRSSTNKS